jgi:hypothetical protein
VGTDWIAFFTDAEHEVQTVTEGHRVTMAYTLHIGEDDRAMNGGMPQRCTCEVCIKKQHKAQSASASAASSSRRWRRDEEEEEEWMPMEHIFDVTSVPPTEEKGKGDEEEEEATEQGKRSLAAAASSSNASLPVAPAADARLPLPLAWHRLRSSLQSSDYATYCLPSAVVDLVLGYLADASPLHALFALPKRSFQQIAVLLAHAYPYAAIARAADEAANDGPSSARSAAAAAIGDAVAGAGGSGGMGASAAAASDAAASSSSSSSAALPSSSASSALPSSSASAVPASVPLLRRASSLPGLLTAHAPPASFFLKGRDRDVFDALRSSCEGTSMRVRVAPVHVHIAGAFYRGEHENTTQPAELQLIEQADEHPEWAPLDADAQKKPNYSRSINGVGVRLEEILAFIPHAGTVDRTARALSAPQTIFLNQSEFLSGLLTQRAVHSEHEADFDPRGESIDHLSHCKRSHSYGAYVSPDACLGNAGYDEHIELQYIAAAILIEQEEEEAEEDQ